jgi:hypothetical protein
MGFLTELMETIEGLAAESGLDCAAFDLETLAGHVQELGIDPSTLSSAEVNALVDAYTNSGHAGSGGELQFGADTALKKDLIIAADGTGYKYPSDFVRGVNGYRPA